MSESLQDGQNVDKDLDWVKINKNALSSECMCQIAKYLLESGQADT